MANGTVQVNTRSPAYYLNQNFYGDVNVPASASPTATPDWTVVDRTGQLRMARPSHPLDVPGAAAAGQGQGKRTKIFNWQVPIEVGATTGDRERSAVLGARGRHQDAVGAIVALVVIVLAGSRWCSWCVGAGGTPGRLRGGAGRQRTDESDRA